MAGGLENETDKQDDEEASVLREVAAELEHEAHALENTAHEMEDRAHNLEERAHKIEEAHKHDHEHRHHHVRLTLTVVVNGTPITIEASSQEPLGEIRKKALEETKNVARPPEQWEIKNEAGDVLDPLKTVGDYNLANGDTLFLSLSAGVAGV